MFEYFTGPKYIWNLGVAPRSTTAGRSTRWTGRAGRRGRPPNAVTRAAGIFMQSWKAVADQVADQARASEAAGHLRTAGQQWFRSAALRLPGRADAQQRPTPADRRSTSRRWTRSQKVFELADPATTRVEVPFEGTTLPAYFSNASEATASPCRA